MSAHYSLASVVFIASLALTGPLAAQPMAAPTLPLVQPTPWSAGYGEARAAMLAGDFAIAATKFAALVDSAPDSASRFLALEMMSACRTWARGGFVLTTPQRLALSASAALEDRRTTDEIAILYTNAVLYGLYAGIVLDVWTDASSAGSAILPPLALAGASAGVVAILDRNVRLGYGVAQSIVSGMYVGFEEGIAWTLWHEASVQRSSEFGAKAVTTLIWGLGTLGAVAGGVVGAAYGTTPGRASLMGSAAMWSGLVAGTLAGGITDHADSALLSSAVALNAGAVLGAIAGAEVSPSIARVRFIDLGGLSGGLLLGGLYWAVKDRKATGAGLLTATSLGMTAGLTAGWLLTRDMESDLPRKHRQPSLAERLVPTLVPASTGTGLVLGVASTI
ncbi:MAG TPA: hypothetical protein VF524_01450 [Polyangia bacterium]